MYADLFYHKKSTPVLKLYIFFAFQPNVSNGRRLGKNRVSGSYLNDNKVKSGTENDSW